MHQILSILVSWAALAIAFAVAAWLLPGLQIKGGFRGHAIVAAIFGVLMVVLGDVLFTMIGLGTLGLGFLLAFLTRLVVGTLLLVLTDKLTRRLSVSGWGTAFLAALIVSVVGAGAEHVLSIVLR